MHFKIRRLSEYSKETLLEELKRVATFVGAADLTQAAFRENSRAAPGTVSRHFGSWEEALRAAGLRTSALESVTPAAAIAELNRVGQHLAQTEVLTTASFQRLSRISPRAIIRCFGTWRKALEAASMAHRFNASSQKISRHEILREIHRVAELIHAKELTIQQFEQHSRFGAKVARKEFGSWHHAARDAGFAGSPKGQAKTDDECFDNLLAVWTHYGRAPSQREMARSPSMLSASVYSRRFGSWMRALEAFVARVNQDVADLPAPSLAVVVRIPHADDSVLTSEPPLAVSDATRSNRVPESDKREIRLGLRYAVLSRDRFRCVACGRSPATVLGVNLHIDHILAWSKGGKTTLANLRTTCADCNLGKGTRCEV
jgi:Homing endonuclease associated repeat/HNH endonuclease